MKITKVVVGLLEENCYVLEKDKQVIVVDPGDEYERIKKVIGRKKVAGVLITHNHFENKYLILEGIWSLYLIPQKFYYLIKKSFNQS